MNNFDISAVDKSAIDHTFASQKAYALKLRKSTCAERLEVLARFEKVFKASYDQDVCRSRSRFWQAGSGSGYGRDYGRGLRARPYS